MGSEDAGSFHVQTGYTSGEGVALVAPLAGLTPEQVQVYLVVTVGTDGSVRVSAPEELLPGVRVSILLHAADHLAGGLQEEVQRLRARPGGKGEGAEA